MDGSPVSPAVLDCSLHSLEESGEPSPLFFGLHATNHKIRWNQINRKRPQLSHPERPSVSNDLRALLVAESGNERPAVFELDFDPFAGLAA
jgi:hypothetical protein